MTDLVDKQEKPWRFKKGQTGNPKGRTPGTRNKATLAAEALLDGDAANLTRKCVELALAGDVTALRLALERILPPRKSRPVEIAFGDLEGAGGLARASGAVLAALGRGEIAPDEAQAIGAVVEFFGSALERRELAARIDALEGKHEQDA
jgi:Family of unknown function (DUF5681)